MEENGKKKKKKKQNIIRSFNAAIEGVIYTFKSERNMKIHYMIAFGILVVSLLFKLSKLEFIMLLVAITLVIVAEMFNTAIEKTVDLVTSEYHELAKIAKDVAAGAVLVVSLNAVAVGYIIFYDKLTELSGYLIYSIRESEMHITLICIVMVLLAVVVAKALTNTGTPLKGGMPSGHSALASSIFTIITYLTHNPKILFLTLILVVLVMHSRIEGKIHTLFETVMGGLLGWAITYLILSAINM